jgi:protein SCO1/2
VASSRRAPTARPSSPPAQRASAGPSAVAIAGATASALDGATPEPAIGRYVDEARRAQDGAARLAALLPEALPLYAGRSANATLRIRGYILAAFEDTGLPRPALPYVLEALESGRDAYLVAAAARGLRGLRDPQPPTTEVAPCLVRALHAVRHADDRVTFATLPARWPAPDATTALAEVLATLAWLGPRARSVLPDLEALRDDPPGWSPAVREAFAVAIAAIAADTDGPRSCCGGTQVDRVPSGLRPIDAVGLGTVAGTPPPAASPPLGPRRNAPLELVIQDQDGQQISFGELFLRRPSVVAFFYTRCTNPAKCSLTITKLARLQAAAAAAGLEGRLNLVAFTYDPAFDLPRRLRAYGEDRGFRFGATNRLLRAPDRFAELRDYFGLNVGYGPASVNQHAVELHLLDASAAIARSWTRLQWPEAEVLDAAARLVRAHHAATAAEATGQPDRS